MAIDRRSFLRLGGAGVLGVTFVSLLEGCEEFLVTPLGSGEAPFITPVAQFYVQNGGEGSIAGWTEPDISTADWRLEITEVVTPPNPVVRRTVTWDDLMGMRDREVTILKTIQCVLESPLRTTPTGFIATATFTGIPLSLLLEGIDFSPSTKRILFYGADRFYNNITIDRLTQSSALGLIEPLLVYRMNGDPLTREHGAPVRLIIQEGFGYKQVKWLKEIRAVRFDQPFGTYQEQGFVDDGVMRTNSRATNVREGGTLPAGPVRIKGFAVSGYAPVTLVEVSVDGGPFVAAEIVPLAEIRDRVAIPEETLQLATGSYPFRGVWTEWEYRWEATPGSHVIRVRATDAEGNVQPAVDETIYDGRNGVATYDVRVA